MSEPKSVEILNVFRERGSENGIGVYVSLSYLKSRPLAQVMLTPAAALKLAGELVRLVEQDIRAGRT